MSDYNSMIGYKNLPYNIISYLIENNENIWKLLKYNTSDALDKPNLSHEEKAKLIYNGEIDATNFRVFMNEFVDDAYSDMVSQLRIINAQTASYNKIVAVQDIKIQIVTHNKIDVLNDYTTRLDTMIEEIISTLNGVEIGGLGVLFFDGERRRSNSVSKGFTNNRNFFGANVIMSCNFSGAPNERQC